MTGSCDGIDLIEAVARAICSADGMDPDMLALRTFPGKPDFMGESCSLWNHCEDEARAAIAAADAYRAATPDPRDAEIARLRATLDALIESAEIAIAAVRAAIAQPEEPRNE